MSSFSAKNSYLGVDLGASSVKVVELANFKGRPRLVTYGFSERKLHEFSDAGSGAIAKGNLIRVGN